MASALVLRGGDVVLGDAISRADVLLRAGRIVALGARIEPAAVEFNARGLTVLPGLIDIHVHGGGGHSFFTTDPARLAAYASWAPRHGVTAFLASLVGDTPGATAEMLRALHGAAGGPGAELLGFHLEGPWISPTRRGAFPESALRPPSSDEFRAWVDAAGGRLRMVTLAPELPGALDLVGAVVNAGAVAAAGHTDATAAQMAAGFQRGVSHVTHLFNAMRPIHQREGGPIVAALASSATCELIFDGAHVAPEVLRFAFSALGPRRTVAVTDNLYLAGAGQASGAFAGGNISAVGDVARREDGTIVGSLVPMDRHFRNVVEILGAGLPVAAKLCATNPAQIIGATGRGVIAPGFTADLVLLDRALQVAATFCRGELAYCADLGRLGANA